MTRKLLGVIGQSNELGSGPTGSASRTSGYAAPYIDKVQRSWWGSCVQAAARRGVWLDIQNNAVGATSLCDVWVGRCRAWSNGMVLARGSYVLSGGGLWRSNVAISTAPTSTVAPAGTADVTTADGLAWVYVGVPNGGDTDGAVYAHTSPRYDPNGYIAALISVMQSRPGYAQKGIYVSIGQGDYTVGVTRGQYAAAMQSVAEHISSLGITAVLGVTCGMSGPDSIVRSARDAFMTGVIRAGRSDALTAMAGNSLVKSGADLRAAIGVPAASPNDTALSSVNNVDYLHLTSATYDQAGVIVDAALAAAGF